MSSTPSSSINSLYSLNGIPLFTYGMIGATTIALACITMMDDSNESFAKDEGYEKSKTGEGSSTFGNFFGSKKTDESTSDESKKDSMFSSFGFGKKEENSPTEPTEEPEKEVTNPDIDNPKQGGKYRKTKSNIIKYKHNKSKKVPIS